VLIRAWEQQVLKVNPVTQSLRESVYQEYLSQLGNHEYRVFYVTFVDSEPAQVLIQRLQAGLPWEKVELDSPANPKLKVGPNRTDWINLSAMPAEFRGAVKLLKPGQVYPTAIKNGTGWHVLGLGEIRPIKPPALDQIKTDIEKLAERKIVKDKLMSITAP
jgi:peptidyl-prolyl cis-trans isomerase C